VPPPIPSADDASEAAEDWLLVVPDESAAPDATPLVPPFEPITSTSSASLEEPHAVITS
jgi:hypothetical protein